MADRLLKLWYWVRGSPFANVASIQAPPNSSVDILRDLIIKSSQLNVPSNAVSLYKLPQTHAVNLSDDTYDVALGKLCISNLGQPLRVAQTVASIFTLHPQESYLHLIVGM